MLNPAFTIKLGQQVYPGLVTCGKFDGIRPSLACGTTGGKILIHSPHEVQQGIGSPNSLNAVRYLNLNRKITALTSGSLGPIGKGPNPEMIFVGTQSNLLAYDVERNADAFFADVQDGVNTLLVGCMGNSSQPLAIAGGNCSVLGFDSKGSESFWTVTGDNVAALALCDFHGDGLKSLVVGSDDFEIRVFKNEELLTEITEADRVTFLNAVSEGKFAYGLANGTVGLYTGIKNRLWRVKTKNKVTALFSYDLDLDGVPEIFSGWSNGMFNVRRESTGEVIFKETMDAPIAGILKADYRMDGKEEVMICSEAGEVRAYLATDVEFGSMVESGIAKDHVADQKVLNDLQTAKLELLAELKLLEKAVKNNKSSEAPPGSLPPSTSLTYSLTPDLESASVVLKVEVNTDVQIVNLVAVDLEGVVLVDREVIAISPKALSKSAILPLKPSKIAPCKLRVQTHIATRNLGGQLHCFEADIMLVRFCVFRHITDPKFETPISKVTFSLRESVARIIEWLQSGFILAEPIRVVDDKFKLNFAAVCPTSANNNKNAKNMYDKYDNRVGPLLSLQVSKFVDGNQSYVKMRIYCDNIELVSELVQDLAAYFKVTDLESEADFPVEMEAFEEVVKRVADGNATRIKLAVDMADDSQRIKALVIRAEDSRLMVDMSSMRKAYTELNGLNQQLCTSYNVRATNHENLLNALKEVNQMIQKAANLRVGKAKARVISECRTAVKLNNMPSLFRIIKQGYEPNPGLLSAQPKN